MAAGTEETLPDDDPGLEGGEWLFRRDGQVFGPIDSRQVAAMLYRGELDAATPISAGDGTWRPVAEVSTFLVHVKKAEAGLRVEREVTGARLLRARQGRRRLVAAAAAAILLVAAAVGGVFVFARRTAETSPLLEDFGAGIRIASAARVGVSRCRCNRRVMCRSLRDIHQLRRDQTAIRSRGTSASIAVSPQRNANGSRGSSNGGTSASAASAHTIAMNHTEFLKSPVYRQFKRFVILITGGIVLLIGIALLVLPGPAFIVIPIGLSILALEFAWARRWKRRALKLWQQSSSKLGNSSPRSGPSKTDR